MIPPRGLPTCGPPKSCSPQRGLAPHSSFCNFPAYRNDWQVCLNPAIPVTLQSTLRKPFIESGKSGINALCVGGCQS